MTRLPPLDPSVRKIRYAVKSALRKYLAQNTLDNEDTSSSVSIDSPLVLVALSGGADSLALAAAVAFVGREMDVCAECVIIDHNLQNGSAEIAKNAALQAESLGLKSRIVRVQVPDDSGLGIEAAARQARYAALESVAQETKASLVLTAHTMQDQAEQVLLGILRGSGLRSIAGIPERRGIFVRPLLQIKRAETLTACKAQGLQPWNDPHNADSKFTRVKVRQRTLPFLEDELGGHIQEQLAKTAQLATQDADALDEISASAYGDIAQKTKNGVKLSVAQLENMLPAICSRVLKLAITEVSGKAVSLRHLQMVNGLLENWHGQDEITVPGAVVRRENGAIVITSNSD